MSAWLGAGLLAVAIVIVATGSVLPAEVGSHFDGEGRMDATMSRGAYLLLMVVLADGVPLLTWWLQCRAARAGRINFPRRDHWMAPARRPDTLRFLERHAMVMAVVLALFLLGVHLLVVKAHWVGTGPPSLDIGLFTLWVVAFVAFSVLWAAWLWRRFS